MSQAALRRSRQSSGPETRTLWRLPNDAPSKRLGEWHVIHSAASDQRAVLPTGAASPPRRLDARWPADVRITIFLLRVVHLDPVRARRSPVSTARFHSGSHDGAADRRVEKRAHEERFDLCASADAVETRRGAFSTSEPLPSVHQLMGTAGSRLTSHRRHSARAWRERQRRRLRSGARQSRGCLCSYRW